MEEEVLEVEILEEDRLKLAQLVESEFYGSLKKMLNIRKNALINVLRSTNPNDQGMIGRHQGYVDGIDFVLISLTNNYESQKMRGEEEVENIVV